MSAATGSSAPPLSRHVPRVVIATAVVSAWALGVVWALQRPSPGARDWLLALLVVSLSAVAYKAPVKIATRRVVYLDAALHALALLTLSPAFAALAAGAGVALGNISVRRPWFNTLFNVAQVTLSVLLAALLYRASAAVWDSGFGSATGVLVAGITLYVAGALAVAMIMLVQGGRNPFANVRAVHGPSFAAHAILVGIGAAIAPAVHGQPWLILLAVVPVATFRSVIERTIRFDAGALTMAERLALSAEQAHPQLAGRAARVATLAYEVAQRAGLAEEACYAVALAARLHDVPAASLPPEVIVDGETRSGRQRLYHEQHPEQVADFAGRTLRLHRVAEVLRQHHARFDGRGIPLGLAGHDIMVEARILAVCDAWVDLISEHHTRPPLDESAAAMMLRAGAGTQWDPRMVGLVLKTVFEDGSMDLAQFEEVRSAELAG